MAGLVNAQLAAAGERDLGKLTPTHALDRTARNSLLHHCRDEGIDVGAHEVELVNIVPPRWMNRQLRWWEAKDEPAVPNVDVREPQDVAKKRPVHFGFPAVDYRVCADDHARLLCPVACESESGGNWVKGMLNARASISLRSLMFCTSDDAPVAPGMERRRNRESLATPCIEPTTDAPCWHWQTPASDQDKVSSYRQADVALCTHVTDDRPPPLGRVEAKSAFTDRFRPGLALF
jgi:hypothetical protein